MSCKGDQLLVAQAGGTYIPLVYTTKATADVQADDSDQTK